MSAEIRTTDNLLTVHRENCEIKIKYRELQAENEIMQAYIDKLETRLCEAKLENKSLNNALEQNKIVSELLLEDYKSLKQSRDILLLVCQFYRSCMKLVDRNVIDLAEQKKEKETE